MTTESLTGVWGVARRHRAQRNTGDSGRRGVASLAPSVGWGPSGESEGSTVPLGPARQKNWWGGNPAKAVELFNRSYAEKIGPEAVSLLEKVLTVK